MDYNEFLEYVQNNLADCYKEIMASEEMEREGDFTKDIEEIKNKYNNCQVKLQHVLKNNGIELDAVSIYIEGKHLSPNIYLKPFFDSYRMGKPLSFVMMEIIYQYKKYSSETDINEIDINDFKSIRNDIVLRLVNYDRNKEMLKECPYKLFLDLAITFRCIVNEDDIGMASIMITNKEFDRWDVDLEDLYQLALFNTVQRYPWQMIPISKVVMDCFESRINELPEDVASELKNLRLEETGVNMFVLTNQPKVFGAACLIYDNVIKNFAKVQESNVYIMPSSVHEVMLVPEDDTTSSEFLQELLDEANRSSVGLIDLLSDHIYYYDRDMDKIVINYPS